MFKDEDCKAEQFPQPLSTESNYEVFSLHYFFFDYEVFSLNYFDMFYSDQLINCVKVTGTFRSLVSDQN